MGYGKYADVNGKVTHFTKDGKKLEKITAENGGGTDQTGGDLSVAKRTLMVVDQGAISITFGRFNPPTTGHENF